MVKHISDLLSTPSLLLTPWQKIELFLLGLPFALLLICLYLFLLILIENHFKKKGGD